MRYPEEKIAFPRYSDGGFTCIDLQSCQLFINFNASATYGYPYNSITKGILLC